MMAIISTYPSPFWLQCKQLFIVLHLSVSTLAPMQTMQGKGFDNAALTRALTTRPFQKSKGFDNESLKGFGKGPAYSKDYEKTVELAAAVDDMMAEPSPSPSAGEVEPPSLPGAKEPDNMPVPTPSPPASTALDVPSNKTWYIQCYAKTKRVGIKEGWGKHRQIFSFRDVHQECDALKLIAKRCIDNILMRGGKYEDAKSFCQRRCTAA